MMPLPFPPPPVPVTYDPLPMQVMAFVIILVVLAVYAGLTWVRWHGREVRARVLCPIDGRAATVTIRQGFEHEPTDVVRCTIFGRHPITCTKACLTKLAGARA